MYNTLGSGSVMPSVPEGTRGTTFTHFADEGAESMDFNVEGSSYGTLVASPPRRPTSSPSWQTDGSSVLDSEILEGLPMSDTDDLHPSHLAYSLTPADIPYRHTPSGLRYSYTQTTSSATPKGATAYWYPPDTSTELLTVRNTSEFRISKRVQIPCVVCGRGFRDERAVYQHLKAKHSHLVLADAEGFSGERGVLERQRLRYANDAGFLESEEDVRRFPEGVRRVSVSQYAQTFRESTEEMEVEAATASGVVPGRTEVPDHSVGGMTLSIRTKNLRGEEEQPLIGMSMAMAFRPKPKLVGEKMEEMEGETCE